MSTPPSGRGFPRPAALAATLLLAAGGLWLALASERPREPAAVPNPAARPPDVSRTNGYPSVANQEALEHLVLDSVPPSADARLLFYQGRATHPDGARGVYTLDGSGGVLRIDRRLNAMRIPVHVEGRDLASVAPDGTGGLWLVTGDGEVIRTDRGGRMRHVSTGAFRYSLVAADAGGTGYLVRSPARTAFDPVMGRTPLVTRLDSLGGTAGTIGSGVVPADFLLTHLASAGYIAVTDSVIYYAPFIRDEVLALTPAGDTLWVATRGLPQSTAEPRFEVVDGEPVVDYAPVNLGLALGPNGHLYVLSIPGFTTAEARLDVLDPANGHLLQSTRLDTPAPTLAADADGRVYALDPFALLTGVPARERSPFAEFELDLLRGGTMSSADLLDRVTLVNFWASWCAPCRVEMPALDGLQRSITDPTFQFITMNEDVNVQDAMLFLRDYRFDFPVLLGRGELKRRFHYMGLPYTVLLDRQGRMAARWIGYAGDQQIEGIRAVIEAELREGPGAPDTMDHETHSPGPTGEAAATHGH